MNRLEELLVILQEEAAEVTQCVAKCIRFGMNSIHHDKSNQSRLEEELGDFLAILKLISEETDLDYNHIFECVDLKLIKVEKYMKNGTLPVVADKKHPRKYVRKSHRS